MSPTSAGSGQHEESSERQADGWWLLAFTTEAQRTQRTQKEKAKKESIRWSVHPCLGNDTALPFRAI